MRALLIVLTALAGCTYEETVVGPEQGAGGEVEPVVVAPMAPAPEPVPEASGVGRVRVTCAFDDAWVSVMPASVFNPGEEFLMQALIGFSTDPAFWESLDDYAPYRPYAAQRCDTQSALFDVPAGDYYVLVGWAGRYQIQGYSRNGYLERISVGAGQALERAIGTGHLTHDWVCISCPWLVVLRYGRFEDVQQVLIDRYTRRRQGTDVVTTEVDVRGGRVLVRVEEREPEITRLDAVRVRIGGRELPSASDAAVALPDGVHRALSIGESLTLAFDAAEAGIADGTATAEIEIDGYYEPVGPVFR